MRDTVGEAIRFEGVSLGFGARRVLEDVRFALPSAGFIGLLGANGAGKTTLLRAVLGLARPHAGRISVLGGPAGASSSVGYMPQLRRPAPRLTGRDVLAACWRGERWGLPWPGRAGWREVDRALALVDAAGLARRPLAELSGGERQRIWLAQALMGSPRILLLDEPLASLDPGQQGAVIDLVRRLRRELGLLVLFSAHELNPLLGVLDQVLHLGAGQAVLGTVEEVINGPVLSRLYGAPIEVLRHDGRIFVMSGGLRVERDCAACAS